LNLTGTRWKAANEHNMRDAHNLSAGLRPVILDFDASVLPLDANETRLALGDWQEAIRFGCTLRTFKRLEKHLDTLMPGEHGGVFTGSGDYHHLSLYLLRHLARKKALPPNALDLVVCDNHPDNMRYPFGLHCGSWVRHAGELAWVRHIHVIGITSPDIRPARSWENYLGPFIRKKLFYWSIGSSANWLALIGRQAQAKGFDTADTLLAAFLRTLDAARSIYLSIDKDVFSPELARTNWDQGVFSEGHLEAVIAACAGKLAGADITGDISEYAYHSGLKRFFSFLDGQTRFAPGEIQSAQATHRVMNIKLLALLNAAISHGQGNRV
jgi:hypothetical protein